MPPYSRMTRLVFLAIQHRSIALRVDFSNETLPGGDEGLHGERTGVVRVIEGLDDGDASRNRVGPVDVVEPEEEVVWGCERGFVHAGDFRGVLAGVAGSVADSAVHADGGGVRAGPLAIAIEFLGGEIGPVVRVEDVGQGLDAKVSAVGLVCGPG